MKNILAAFWPLILIGLIVASLIFCWEWYVSGQQVEIYEQQGVHMTRWQCFIGVKPAGQLNGGK